MNRLSSFKRRMRTGISLVVAATTVYALSVACLTAADPKTQKETKPEQKTEKKTKKPSGADLYAIHCNRCHAERYPTEFNPTQWKTLMVHMRVRANLPAGQAKLVLKYLQEEAGN